VATEKKGMEAEEESMTEIAEEPDYESALQALS